MARDTVQLRLRRYIQAGGRDVVQGLVLGGSGFKGGSMVGSTERVCIAMLSSWPEYYVEVVTGQCLQPSEDHPLRFFHSFDPLHGSVIRPKDELPLSQVVSPLSHEMDGRENFPFVG